MKNRVLFYSLTLSLLILLSGCFFGKKKAAENTSAPGTLGNGQSILGSFGYSVASLSETDNPSTAITTTYTFDPNLAARIEVKDPHIEGFHCIAYGQYRVVSGQEVLIYVQATSGGCAFPSPIHLSNVEIKSQYMKYTDPQTNDRYTLFYNRNISTFAPIGLWDFRGTGGIDYMLFDENGYALVQVTIENEMYLLVGYYTIAGAGIRIYFFDGENPENVQGEPLEFESFATDGLQLQLTQKSEDGSETYLYKGYRL
ncbi:MAG: hypothetical protein AB7F43_07375 [Bacteriovoracia bacterium]